MFSALLQLSPFLKYKILGNSMFPALKPGQNVLVNRFPKPKVGDIIAIKDPRNNKILIKRISETKNNKFFVLGDNKNESTDSRHFGWITKKDIIGKVVYKLKVQS